MLRSFVTSDTFSETDLSTCLRQAGYNVELAAERLMTGQYQPAKRQKVLAPAASTSPKVTAPRVATPKPLPAPSLSLKSMSTKIRKPTPVTPKTPSPVAPVPVASKENNATSKSSNLSTTSSSSIKSQSNSAHSENLQSTKDSWLLCHRWISDGICLQRNGSVSYQEAMQVEHNFSSTSPKNHKTATVRFRGSRVLGQFPKHLSPLLGPLLEANLIQVEARALMEERSLQIGNDVAFAVW